MTSTDSPTNEQHPNARVLAAGLRWLYETEQPEGALLTHHGEGMKGEGNRRFYFIPEGADGPPVVAVEVAEIVYRMDDEGDKVPANPLEPDELTDLASALAALGVEVARTWNGHPATTGSLGLVQPAHSSLLAAVNLYRAGCPTHPHKSVFCGCGWYPEGHAKVVTPRIEAEVTR
jgi:hypothetical protein